MTPFMDDALGFADNLQFVPNGQVLYEKRSNEQRMGKASFLELKAFGGNRRPSIFDFKSEVE